MVKLKDIAEFANVSISTVSRVLNGKNNVNKETNDRVMEACNKLLYNPSSVIKKVNHMNKTIAIYIPAKGEFLNDNPTTSVDINSIMDEIQKMGCKVVLTTHETQTDTSSVPYKIIQNKEIDAAIVSDPYIDDEYIELLEANNIPHLVTNGILAEKSCSYIDYNNFQGAIDVIQYLYSLGHREIGIIGGPDNHMVCQNRLDGVKECYRQLGMTFKESNFIQGDFSIDSGYQGMQDLLKKNSGISAVFAFSDQIAFGAMKFLKDQGVSIPDDMSIVGFDDLALSEFIEPALTTVSRFRYDISPMIARTIYDLLTNHNVDNMQILLKTKLVIRGSCGRRKGSV